MKPRLFSVLAILAALAAGSVIFLEEGMFNLVVASPAKGVLTLGGKPLAGAQLKRTIHFSWASEQFEQKAISGPDGSFEFNKASRFALMAWFPHEITGGHVISWDHGPYTLNILNCRKTGYAIHDELGGDPINLSFDLAAPMALLNGRCQARSPHPKTYWRDGDIDYTAPDGASEKELDRQMRSLLNSGNPAARRESTMALVERWLLDPSAEIRRKALESHFITSTQALKLQSDPDEQVRYAAFSHESSPPESLATALSGSDRVARLAAARNAKTPQAALLSALNGPDEEIAKLVAGNKSIDSSSLIARISPELAKPHLDAWLESAMESGKIPQEWVSKALGAEFVGPRLAAARHGKLTSNQVDSALADADAQVRRAAVKHQTLNARHIQLALSDADPWTRVELIAKGVATRAQIESLLQDPVRDVRMLATEILIRNHGVDVLSWPATTTVKTP